MTVTDVFLPKPIIERTDPARPRVACRNATISRMRIDVASSLTMSSPAPATALLQVAVAAPQSELLTVIRAGRPADVEEFCVGGARVHRVQLAEGSTTVAYAAAVDGGGPPRPVTAADWAEALRPS